MDVKRTNIGIVGGGLTGTMAACFLAKRGFQVNLYEMRIDPRNSDNNNSNIHNLILSERGLLALKALGIEKDIIDHYAIKQRGYIYHLKDTEKLVELGDGTGRRLFSINRQNLIIRLLNELEKYENIKIKFNLKLIDMDIDQGKMRFKVKCGDSGVVEEIVDYIIGTDGAYSKVKALLNKVMPIELSQALENCYIKFIIPPKSNGEYALDPLYIHSWPGVFFRAMAFADLSGNMTVDIIMSNENFKAIRDQDTLLTLFEQHFPNIIELIGKEMLIKTFFETKPSWVITTKCKPYNYNNKVLLMGDAAHAFLQIMGQGMNAGFEDCLVLDELLDLNNNNMSNVFPMFSKCRVDDCHAFYDFTLNQHRSFHFNKSQNSIIMLFLKYLDQIIKGLFPNDWISYEYLIMFTRTPYKKCLQHQQMQKYVHDTFTCIIYVIGIVIFSYFIYTILFQN